MISSLLLVLGVLAGETGTVYSGLQRDLRVSAPRLDERIQVDGHLSEATWGKAARLTGFSQYAPDDRRPARNETEVLVWYSPQALHFGIRANAAAGSIRATLADRDRIDNDDWIQIYLGTFNDGRHATVFGVNPLGVQMDGALVEGSGTSGGAFGGLAGGRSAPDVNPDFVFESKGRLTPTGYEVEIRIPFKSLRYQSAPTQDWGLHVIRRVQSAGHDDSWAPALRSSASFLGQAGTLTGLTGLQRGIVMDVTPSVVAGANGRRSGGDWSYDGRRPDLGGNVRWGVTPNVTVNATVNPDFSQIEADATQFQIDPRQALFFAEKRPFFLDGIEFFSTPGNLVYSRRIVDPIAAVKLTGKMAGTSVAALAAVDDQGQARDGDSNPFFSIARVQRDFGGASRVGFLYTARADGASSNHVAGVDSRLVWQKMYSLDLQMAVSHTSLLEQGTTGRLWQTAVRRTGRRYSFRYTLSGNEADFHTDAGFIGRRGVVTGNLTNQLALYGRQRALIERWTGDVQIHGTWNHADFFDGARPLEQKLHLNSNVFARGGWQSGLSVLIEKYRFDPKPYAHYAVLDGTTLRPFAGQALPNLDFVFTLNTPRVRGVSANVFHLWGRDENFAEWSSANIVYSTVGLLWRPSERLRVDGNYSLQSFRRRSDNSFVGIRRVPRIRLEYQATRTIFLRYVGEYATNYQDALRDDSRTGLPIVFLTADGGYVRAAVIRQRSFRNDWLFSYQPRPGTVLFAGYGNALTNAQDPRQRTIRRTRDGFFVKLSYLWRL